MSDNDEPLTALDTSDVLAVLIVDALIDGGFIQRSQFDEAVVTTKFELDCQHGMGRVKLRDEAQ